ncbi:MAG: dihydroorotase [Pseudomonadota bacterium]
MTQTFDLILRGGAVVNHDGEGLRDVGVRAGKIAEIGSLSTAEAGEVVDCKGLHVLPGVIDTQVHFREPGAEAKEDLATGSLAAVAGGVVAVFEMPNTRPNTTTAAALEEKLSRAQGRMYCDHAFYMGAAKDNASKLGELEMTPGCCGVKVFMGASTGDLLVPDDAGLREVLRHGRRRVAIHSEDEGILEERRDLAVDGDWASHAVVRNAEAAIKSTQRLLAIARETHRLVHVLHISTAEEIDILAEHKDIATVEATPQHLTLAAPEAYAELNGFAQMNPPIRDARHRDGLWRGIARGVVDVIGSDHAPHLREEKAKPYPASPSGMPGVQTLVPIMLDHVNAGRLSLARFVDLTSHGPNRIFGIAGKGRLAVGYDADFTVVDLKREVELGEDWVRSKCGWSPFTGRKVTGWPVGTIIRGRRVMWEDEVIGSAAGEPVRFQQTLG